MRYRVNAMSSACGPGPAAMTTNCCPDRVRQVIGFADVGNGAAPPQIQAPFALSNAHR